MIPEPKIVVEQPPNSNSRPEDMIFDKAEKAAQLEELRERAIRIEKSPRKRRF